MMEKQSLEFITGYIFSKVENQILNAHVNKLEKIKPSYVYVPKSWFGMECSDHVSLKTQCELDLVLRKLCQSYNTKYATYSFSFYIKPKEQYILFMIEGTKMSALKEMTIEEIEKELGYKIKIVGEH